MAWSLILKIIDMLVRHNNNYLNVGLQGEPRRSFN